MTALQPISVITGRVIAKRDCTMIFLIFFYRISGKRGCPLIRACSLIRSNTVGLSGRFMVKVKNVPCPGLLCTAAWLGDMESEHS